MKTEYLKIGAVAIVIALLGAGIYLFVGEETDAEKIEKMGTVLENGALCGLVVPSYTAEQLEISSISDLNGHASDFDNEIIGIDAGAGITELTNKAITEYDLSGNFALITSSEAAMLAALDAAYESGSHIVVTLWDPHWATGVYDLVFLEDPQLVYGEAESIESWARPGLKAEDPVLAKIMEQYSYEMDEFSGLLAYIESNKESMSAGEATQNWIEQNPTIKERWLDGVEYQEGRGEITIGLVDWACATGSSNVLKHLLEDVGYSVTLMSLDAGAMYAGLAYGNIDLITTAWVPLTHAQYMERYA
ncbi:MAG: glycine betaine ABC transporter substrate-binding protein [Candidatus Methanomethylophilaceae archaeon]